MLKLKFKSHFNICILPGFDHCHYDWQNLHLTPFGGKKKALLTLALLGSTEIMSCLSLWDSHHRLVSELTTDHLKYQGADEVESWQYHQGLFQLHVIFVILLNLSDNLVILICPIISNLWIKSCTCN